MENFHETERFIFVNMLLAFFVNDHDTDEMKQGPEQRSFCSGPFRALSRIKTYRSFSCNKTELNFVKRRAATCEA